MGSTHRFLVLVECDLDASVEEAVRVVRAVVEREMSMSVRLPSLFLHLRPRRKVAAKAMEDGEE